MNIYIVTLLLLSGFVAEIYKNNTYMNANVHHNNSHCNDYVNHVYLQFIICSTNEYV